MTRCLSKWIILLSGLFLFLPAPLLAQTLEISQAKKRLYVLKGREDTATVRVYTDLANAYSLENSDSLRFYCEKAIRLSKKLNFRKGLADAYDALGLDYTLTIADPLSLDYYDRATQIYRSIADHRGLASVATHEGYYYGNINDRAGEMLHFKRALAELAYFKDEHYRAVMYGNIGNSFEASGDLDSAVVYYEKMYELGKTNKSWSDVLIISYTDLASAHLKLGETSTALDLGLKGLALVTDSNSIDKGSLSDLNTSLGRIYIKLGNYKLASHYLHKSLVIAKSIGYTGLVITNYRSLFMIDSLKGDFYAAHRNYVNYHDAYDSLTNSKKNKLASLYKIKFENEKKIAENNLLRKKQEENDITIHNQRFSQIFWFISFIIVTSGLLYLNRMFRRIEEQNKIIQKQKTILEESNTVKDKLFSVIAHDLRGPVFQTRELVGIITSSKQEFDDLRSIFPNVNESLNNSCTLLDNMLVWSKNQMHGFAPKPIAFNLNEAVQATCQEFGIQSSQKNIELYNYIAENTIIEADKEMIQIVIRNLLSNSIKFTPPGGKVELSSKIQTGKIIISIADTGTGIDPKIRTNLFSYSYKSTYGTRNEKGTGLGLAICKDFVELNKGRIWVQNNKPTGSIFNIELDYREAPPESFTPPKLSE